MSRLRRLPIGFALALVFPLATLALDLAGLRDWVSVISGTPVPGVSEGAAAAGGALYLFCWLASVVLSPALVLATLVYALLDRITQSSADGSASGTSARR